MKNKNLWDVTRFVLKDKQQGFGGNSLYPSIKLHSLSFRKYVTYVMTVMGTANPVLIKDFVGDLRLVS